MSWASDVERESAKLAMRKQLDELRAWAEEQLGRTVYVSAQGLFLSNAPLIAMGWRDDEGIGRLLATTGDDVQTLVMALRGMVTLHVAEGLRGAT